MANGLRPVSGEILSVDDKSITLKLQDGSSRIILLSNQTNLNKTSPANKADLTIGSRVSALGTLNSDGSLTARNLQINPFFRGGDNNQGTPSLGR